MLPLFLCCYAGTVGRFSPAVVPYLYLDLVSACVAMLVTFRVGKESGVGKVGEDC